MKNKNLDQKTLIKFYKDMLFYRRFEERIVAAYTQQKFSGFCHLHIGQEAVCVGVQACLAKDDYVASSYRSHTQAVAKGIAAKFVLAELFGKITGCSKGKGGSMHMFSKEHRFLGGQGIVGAQAPIATGAAFTCKYKETNSIVVCYLGDAAMNQGAVFESINMAATWSLPVLFIIENNQYGMGTDIKRTTNIDKLHKRAVGFGLEGSEVEGMDVLQVYSHVEPLVKKMRKDKKPHLLEIHTYRYKGHSISDPATYRTKDELATYQDQDPIKQLKVHLLKNKYAKESDFPAWDTKIKQEIKTVQEFAESSEEPGAEELYKDVFSTQDKN